MVWYLMYENTLPIRITSEDMYKIRDSYPDAVILEGSQLKDYLEVERMKLIYG